MLIYGPFAILLLFVLAYYVAFEYSRYQTAKTLAKGLGGRAIFRPGKSYMRRDPDEGQERAWIVPDDKMAWGSILSILFPPAGVLYLQRNADPGFRFHIEPKAGMLWRTISLGSLKDADFNVPPLDERLRLRTNHPAKAAAYFSAADNQQALGELFHAGFSQLKGDHGAIVATMKGVSAEDLSPGNIDRSLRHLRAFQGGYRLAEKPGAQPASK